MENLTTKDKKDHILKIMANLPLEKWENNVTSHAFCYSQTKNNITFRFFPTTQDEYSYLVVIKDEGELNETKETLTYSDGMDIPYIGLNIFKKLHKDIIDLKLKRELEKIERNIDIIYNDLTKP